MKCTRHILAGVAALGLTAAPALADDTAEVTVNVSVAEIVELEVDTNSVSLEIADTDNVDTSFGHWVNWSANAPFTLSVSIDASDDIIAGTSFYVVFDPNDPNTWDPGEVSAEWHRQGTGIYDTSGLGLTPGTTASVLVETGSSNDLRNVIYATEVMDGEDMPDANTLGETFDVIWTIAAD